MSKCAMLFDGLLDDEHYRARFKVANPNLKVLAADNIDPATLSRDVIVATDALIVLMAYQNDGYALLSF